MLRRASKRYLVIEPSSDGGVLIHNMKDWCRRNPEQIPPELTPDGDNSQSLLRGFKRMGWNVTETTNEIRISRPDQAPKVDDVLGDGAENQSEDGFNEIDSPSETAFQLERQLQDFIVGNLSTIRVNGKQLRLYEDERRQGYEYTMTNGRRIDILAVDDEGNFVVFELKRGRSPDHAIGQLTNYMGWITLNLAQGKKVSGVIVARTISESLREALTVLPNVFLFEYKLTFSLVPIPVAAASLQNP